VTTANDESAADRTAVLAVRAGNAESFSTLVRKYQRRVFGLALMYVRNPDAAEEVTQDVFVRAYTHLDAYEVTRPFYPWIATITVRLAQNRLVQQRRVTERGAAPPQRDVADGAAVSPLAALIADEQGRSVWTRVAELPAGERSAVILHYRQDLGIKDVARALGVTAGTVKTFLFRARQRLRKEQS